MIKYDHVRKDLPTPAVAVGGIIEVLWKATIGSKVIAIFQLSWIAEVIMAQSGHLRAKMVL
jgi:hypothetical protein